MRAFLVLAVLVTSGCAAPLASLRVEGDRFTAGQTIVGALKNESSFYELQHGVFCLAHLELERGTDWTNAPEPERSCILPLLITAPDTTVSFTYALAPSLPEGRYRLRFEVSRGRFRLFGFGVGQSGDDAVLASPPFSVHEKR